MAPATEMQGSSFLGRISIRRNQIASMDSNNEQELEDLELFQRHVANRFSELLSLSSGTAGPGAPDENNPQAAGYSGDHHSHLLSISWLRSLLDVFLCCEAEFKAVLLMGRDPTQISKPPLDRLVPEMLDRAVKALDICTAVLSGVDCVRHYQRLGEIAVSALNQRPLSDGNVRRAKRALTNLLVALNGEEKDSGGTGNRPTERSWSFGRRGGNSKTPAHAVGQFRSLSWSVGRNWSASKQIHSMTTNLVAPRGAEASGLPLPVYIMSNVIVFVMWALVAAVPCQERTGLMTHLPIPKNLQWAQSLNGLQERIGEEWKKKEKKGSAGLLDEVQKLEKLAQGLVDFAEGFRFPAEEEKAKEVEVQVAEIADICRRMEEGLAPFQLQIRELFHRIVRSRAEILEALDQAGRVPAPTV